jgi:hypothetical protein
MRHVAACRLASYPAHGASWLCSAGALLRCALMRHHCASYNTTSKSFTAAARRTCHYSRNSHFNLSAHWTNRGKCPGVGSLVVKFLRSSYDMERRL